MAGWRAYSRSAKWMKNISHCLAVDAVSISFGGPLSIPWVSERVCSLHITYTMRTPNTITHDSDEKWITFLHPFRRWIELWMCTNMMKAKAQKNRNETTTTSMSTVVRARQFIRIIENLNRFSSFSTKKHTQWKQQNNVCALATRVLFIACESTLDTHRTKAQSHRSSEFLHFVVVCGRAESRSNIWICILRRLMVFPVGWVGGVLMWWFAYLLIL